MLTSPPLLVRAMTPADFTAADALRRFAGWNQTLEDWQRFLNCEPNGCFVAHRGDALVGTGTTISYGPDLGWIGMLLVHPDHRRCGIGFSLLQACMQYLQNQGVRSIKLDATPLGKPLYERHGFQSELTLTRWQRDGHDLGACPAPPQGRSGSQADLEGIGALDQRVFGVSRRLLFGELLKQSPQLIIQRSCGQALAYGMLRPGSRAFYLGPVVANEPALAAEIVDELLAQIPGKLVYWDVLDGNLAAKALARQLGFAPQRPLLRMFYGTNFELAEPLWQFAMVDPAVG